MSQTCWSAQQQVSIEVTGPGVSSLLAFSFLENLPQESWSERNVQSIEFENMEDANIRLIIGIDNVSS